MNGEQNGKIRELQRKQMEKDGNIKITLDNNKIIYLDPDKDVKLNNGNIVKARNLIETDDISDEWLKNEIPLCI
jgi:hypothetical protein